MPIGARIIADSVQPDGVRLTTAVVTLPKIILAELNTHREFSRNSASSRAVPTREFIRRVVEDPVIPTWGRNQPGMQAGVEIDDPETATAVWLRARDQAIASVECLQHFGAHKQDANRLLEPWLHTEVLVTSVSFKHFFAQRCHEAAHPWMRRAAEALRDAYEASTPTRLEHGQWHLPFITDEDRADVRATHASKNMDMVHGREWDDDVLTQVSAARCARVSYLTHDGRRDRAADLDLFHRLTLARPMHASPLEHVAMAAPVSARPDWAGNFRAGWHQLRKHFPQEYTR